MKIGVIKRISKEDLGSGADIPPWVDGLLNALNQFLDPVGNALTKKLTFSDNFLANFTTQSFTHGVELAVNPGFKIKVVGIIPVSAAGGYLISSYGMSPKSTGNVGITLRFSNLDGTAVSAGTSIGATVLILFG